MHKTQKSFNVCITLRGKIDSKELIYSELALGCYIYVCEREKIVCVVKPYTFTNEEEIYPSCNN